MANVIECLFNLLFVKKEQVSAPIFSAYLDEQANRFDPKSRLVFPHSAHLNVFTHANSLPGHPVANVEFDVSWQALPYRFAAALDHSITLLESTRRYGKEDVTDLDKYFQEKEVFDLFSNTISLAETGFFALYMLAAKVNPVLLTGKYVKSLKQVDPSKSQQELMLTGLAPSLEQLLKSTLASDRFEHYNCIRNTLNHRRIMSRGYHYGGERSGQFDLRYQVQDKTTKTLKEFSLQVNKPSIFKVLLWQSKLLDALCICALKIK